MGDFADNFRVPEKLPYKYREWQTCSESPSEFWKLTEGVWHAVDTSRRHPFLPHPQAPHQPLKASSLGRSPCARCESGSECRDPRGPMPALSLVVSEISCNQKGKLNLGLQAALLTAQQRPKALGSYRILLLSDGKE